MHKCICMYDKTPNDRLQTCFLDLTFKIPDNELFLGKRIHVRITK